VLRHLPCNVTETAAFPRGHLLDAARYLENVVNEHAERGWEFCRVNQIGVGVSPGCLNALLGVRAKTN
jgi:hypothetical protein